MYFTAIVMNHKTAPVHIREKYVVSSCDYATKYSNILSSSLIDEALIVSTCNRVEYYFVSSIPLNTRELYKYIAFNSNLDFSSNFIKYFLVFKDSDAVRHIMKVASGIDSLVVGEPQILGQIKDSFRIAKSNGSIKSYLNILEQSIYSCAKLVRNKTGISRNPISISYAAVKFIKFFLGDLTGKTVLIVGAGRMCEIAAYNLQLSNVSLIYIANRSYDRAKALASTVDGVPANLSDLNELLLKVDIVISSTASDDYIITKTMIKDVMSERGGREILMIDMAVPRDIDPSIIGMDNLYLYGIDDLKQIVELNTLRRSKEAAKAHDLVNIMIDKFYRKINSLSANPFIVDLLKSVENIARDEVDKFCLNNNIHSAEELLKLEALVSTISNKILHAPISGMKALMSDRSSSLHYDLKNIFKKLFSLQNRR